LLELNKVYQGDCLEIMKDIDDKSIDMILADLPYNTTACKWDKMIPLEPLWEQYKRIIKDNGAIVLTASQPFTSKLVMSNPKMFKYCWVWNKKKGGSPLLSKVQPIRITEDIIVFCKAKTKYNPIMIPREKLKKRGKNKGKISETTNNAFTEDKTYTKYYPKSIIEISNANQKNKLHPTQKPVALFEYLIKTYTNEGDLVLDNVAGSGTTGVACQNLGRSFILIEKEPEYVEICEKRLAENSCTQDQRLETAAY
jgi:site-specific DNA-methyltransferase (adenine-specific)